MTERPRGPLPGWKPTTERQKAVLADIRDVYSRHAETDSLPLGPRGVFYALRPGGFSRGVTYFKRKKDPRTDELPNLGPMEADAGTVGDVLSLARRAGFIREDWVDDERAPDPIVPLEFADAAEATDWIDRIVDTFRLERQAGQDMYVEVWCEAAGISGRLAAVAGPRGVPVHPGGGFDGIKGKRAAARLAAGRTVPTVALQVGDYDQHGWRIFKAKAQDVAHWVKSYVPVGSAWSDAADWRVETSAERVILRADDLVVLEVVRLAVTEAQVADGLVELDENHKAEAEQLPAEWRILADELDRLLDPRRRESVQTREETERARLRELLADRWGRGVRR